MPSPLAASSACPCSGRSVSATVWMTGTETASETRRHSSSVDSDGTMTASTPTASMHCRRRTASSIPPIVIASVRPMIRKSGERRARSAARRRAAISSSLTSALPAIAPQRFGET